MEHEIHEHKHENKGDNNNDNNSQKQIAGAIILAGVLIAGAILLKGNTGVVAQKGGAPNVANVQLEPISAQDRVSGNENAKVTVIEYADFQCPYCGRFHSDAEQVINNYVKNGKVKFVYRDYAFLGPESLKSAEAARCASDQGKFWEYHDYLFTHQNGENKGAFSNPNLKIFAKTLGLDTALFDTCLDTAKYASAVTASNQSASKAGVDSTPKGFILKNGKIVNTVDGAEPGTVITNKIDAALK